MIVLMALDQRADPTGADPARVTDHHDHHAPGRLDQSHESQPWGVGLTVETTVESQLSATVREGDF